MNPSRAFTAVSATPLSSFRAGIRPSFSCATSPVHRQRHSGCLGGEPLRRTEERSSDAPARRCCTESVWTASILLLYHLVDSAQHHSGCLCGEPHQQPEERPDNRLQGVAAQSLSGQRPSFFCTTSSTAPNIILVASVANHISSLKSGRTTACKVLTHRVCLDSVHPSSALPRRTMTSIIPAVLRRTATATRREADQCLRGIIRAVFVWTVSVHPSPVPPHGIMTNIIQVAWVANHFGVLKSGRTTPAKC
jgi:hypothetical protein